MWCDGEMRCDYHSVCIIIRFFGKGTILIYSVIIRKSLFWSAHCIGCDNNDG